MKLTQSTLAPLSSHQIPESDNESNSLGLDLVNLAQSPTRPPSPGLSASRQHTPLSQLSIPQGIPLSPPLSPRGTTRPLPDKETAPLKPLTP